MCKSSRMLSLILALVFVVACFAGCGGTSSSAAGSTSAASSAGGEAEPVTLRFSWWGGEARHEATIAAAELYMEKNPNVKIEFEYSGWDGYKDKLVTQLSGGTAPDKIEKYVEIYHPDLQGPLDICELMWGEDLFYAMYDEPELVAAVMQLITDTYMRFMERWQALVPPRDDICCHWDNVMHRGQIVLRNDSAMNLSPEFYDTFARAFDSQLMERYGGVIHFCGRGDHYIHLLKTIPNIYGVNMSQPHLNDMATIYQNTVDCGIQLLAFDRAAALRDLSRPGAFHSNLHCFL